MALTIVHQDSINLATYPDLPADVGKVQGSWWNKSMNYSGLLESRYGGTGLDALNEVSVTSTATLTIGKWHVLSGSTFTATLPAGGANGDMLGVRVAPSATGLYTIQRGGGSQIDGATTRDMWAGESALLKYDGTNWNKIAGKTVPFIGSSNRSSASPFAVAATTWTAITQNTSSSGPALMWDAGNGRLVAPRAGTYLGITFAYDNSGNSGFGAIGIGQNSTDASNVGGYTVSTASPRAGAYTQSIIAAKNDYFWPVVFFVLGGSVLCNTADAVPKITLIEQPAW